MSKTFHVKRIQVVSAGMEQAWDFFSSPANLAIITPEKLCLQIISAKQESMYAGQLIEYKVKPLWGIPLYWMTEITHVEKYIYFIDEQRAGPYSLWHHQHHFKEVPGGVEMTDIVHYKLPFLFIGDLANSLFVEKQLKEIFDYRFEKISGYFP